LHQMKEYAKVKKKMINLTRSGIGKHALAPKCHIPSKSVQIGRGESAC